ncbi:peptidase S1 [Mesobacillus campisalis]|uniref:Peptidase S1 n=1 Tax=Mesobacillus campisalis TaxID=1408103 RepID=A0A0M2SXP2_9BACI|nr:trypsin-like peptidase domain-containing protein [Mesobacillus campisalis]KKK37757.1 peptidase S1 [Mesobacillus campisalis]
MKRWILSIITTLVIWGTGAYGYHYVKDAIPSSLTAASTLIAETSGPAEPASFELKEIISQTQKLVVKIELEDGTLGSGFLYNDKGDIVTNAHVVANATDVKVKTTDSNEFDGKVIGVSTEIDVALVRVPGMEGMDPLPIARERKGEIADEILALGSPLGFQNTVTTGIISGLDRTLDIPPFEYKNLYQISAPIAPGNSGGPLVDGKTGEILGINSAVANQGNIGFSIPITDVLPLIEAWSESPMESLPNISLDSDLLSSEESFTMADHSEYLVAYFYESLNARDFVTAYSLLGSSWQSSLSYEEFRGGYLKTVSVSIDEMTTVKNGSGSTVTAVISAEERGESKTDEKKYKVTYELGYENDQLKILSGEGEEIK